MKDIASNMNLFTLLENVGYLPCAVAKRLLAKHDIRTVSEYMDLYMSGELTQRYFTCIANICTEWYICQVLNTEEVFETAA